MYRQSRSTEDKATNAPTYNVNSANWREAISEMQFVNLSNRETIIGKPVFRQSGDIRPMPIVD